MKIIKESFSGYYTDEEQTAATIRDTYEHYGYLADPHTAVAIHAAEQYIKESGDCIPMVVDSTASPYKFANHVDRAVTGKEADSDLAALEQLSAATGTEIPYPLAGLASRRVRFESTIEKADMADAVRAYVKNR